MTPLTNQLLEFLDSCPVCSSPQSEFIYTDLQDITFHTTDDTWSLMKCSQCKVLYLNPRFTESSIGRAYKGYYTHKPSVESTYSSGPQRKIQEQLWRGYVNKKYGYHMFPAMRIGFALMTLLPLRRIVNDQSLRHIPFPPVTASNPRILDVGFGSGEFLTTMQKLDWTVYGIDPDPEVVHAAKLKGLNVHLGPLNDAIYPSDYFDAITFNHVIEHLHNPYSTLKICHNILKPGGYIWIATPNVDSRSHQKFGAFWRGLEVPRHLVIFNRQALISLLRETGFQVINSFPSFSESWLYYSSYTLEHNGANVPFRIRAESNFAACASLFDKSLSGELIILARSDK